MSERTVAEETFTPGARATWAEPTGVAVPMYSATTASSTAARRASNWGRAGRPSSGLISWVVVASMIWHLSLPTASFRSQERRRPGQGSILPNRAAPAPGNRPTARDVRSSRPTRGELLGRR
jgi:hypothetical protein